MANKVNTNTLMKRLFKANDLDTYLEGNESDLECPAFDALLKQYCEQRKMLPAHVIEHVIEGGNHAQFGAPAGARTRSERG